MTNLTEMTDLINPEVLADAISAELPKAIRFSPYAVVDTTLEGQAGDTITVPKYEYIGPAEDLTEGVPMDTTKMQMTTTKATIKETGKAVEVTRTAVLVNIDGTLSEIENQLTLAMADKVDIDYLASLNTAPQSITIPNFAPSTVLDARSVIRDESDHDYVLFINPDDYTELTKSVFGVGGDVAQRALTRAEVSELVGVGTIVKTNRLTQGEAFIQRQGAMRLVTKKAVTVDRDYDVLRRTLVIAANAFYTTHLYDESGVVKITKADA